MIQSVVAVLEGQLRLNKSHWDAGWKQVEHQINRYAKSPLTIKLQIDTKTVMAQIRALHAQLLRLGTVPIPVGQYAAMNAHMAAMAASARSFQAAMNATRVPRMPPIPAGGGGGGRYGRYGGVGGFGTGVMQGIGLPFALNPQMMAGALVGGAGVGSIREAMRTETAAARLGGLTGISPGRSRAMVDQLGRIATDTPGLTRPQAFELGDVLARAGVRDRDIPESTRVLGRLAAMTPDADPHTLAEQTVQTMNAYGMGMDRAPGFTSALAALDAEAVATASQILDITRRMAGAGKAAGLGITETMALGAEMRSVGLPVESGSTAINRIFGKLASRDEQANIERALGLGSGTLGRQYATDPMTALETLFGGIATASARQDVNALDFIRNDLGFENQRDIMAAGQLSGRMGNVRRMTGLADREWSSGEVMGDRFAREAGTTSAAVEELTDSVRALASAAGESSAGLVKAGAKYLTWLSGTYESMLRFGGDVGRRQPMAPAIRGGAAPPSVDPNAAAARMGPFGGFTSLAAQQADAARQRAVVGPFQANVAHMVAPRVQAQNFVGPMPRGDGMGHLAPFNRMMGQFNAFNMNDRLAGIGQKLINIPGAFEGGLSRLAGAAQMDIDAREKQQSMPSWVMDTESAYWKSQSDLLTQDAGQQQVNLLGEIKSVLETIRDSRAGGGAMQAVLGGLGQIL